MPREQGHLVVTRTIYNEPIHFDGGDTVIYTWTEGDLILDPTNPDQTTFHLELNWEV